MLVITTINTIYFIVLYIYVDVTKYAIGCQYLFDDVIC